MLPSDALQVPQEVLVVVLLEASGRSGASCGAAPQRNCAYGHSDLLQLSPWGAGFSPPPRDSSSTHVDVLRE